MTGKAEKTNPNENVAQLHLMADIDVEKLGYEDLKQGAVGHTWISVQWNDPTQVPDDIHASHKNYLKKPGKHADTMGFWPDIAGYHGEPIGYSTNPFKSYVQGHMRQPDDAHKNKEKATRTYDLKRSEVDNVIKYAEGKRGSKYSVYFYNCSTFAQQAVKAAGKSAPSMSKGGICFPNAVYDGIKADQKAGRGNTTVKDMASGDETTVNGPDSKKR